MRFTRFDGRALGHALSQDAKAALEQAAQGAAQAIVDAIYTQTRPGGGPQQPNTAETVRQKQDLGLAPIPLIGKEGLLTKPGLYRLIKTSKGWMLLPPEQREQILTWLYDLGYRLMEIPPKLRADTMDDVLRRVRATLARFGR